MEHVLNNAKLNFVAPNGIFSHVYADAFREGDSLHVVFTQPEDPNSGMSVTNAIETIIANFVVNSVELLPEVESYVWYERYTEPENTLDKVILDDKFRNPRWERVDNSLFSFS